MDTKRYRSHNALRNKYTDMEAEETKKTAKAKNKVDNTSHQETIVLIKSPFPLNANQQVSSNLV